MKRYLFIPMFTLLSQLALADLAVIVSSQSPISSLSENEVRQLFTGQIKTLSGMRVEPLDMPGGSDLRNRFYQGLMGRSPEQMRAYWTRLIFTGQGKPPQEVMNQDELARLLKGSPNSIGYLPGDQVPADAKVVFRVQ